MLFGLLEPPQKYIASLKGDPHLVLGTKSSQWPWLLFSNIHIPELEFYLQRSMPILPNLIPSSYDSFNAQKGGRHQCWLTMPERKLLNRTGNQIDHKISTTTTPSGGGGTLKIDDTRHVKWVRKKPPWVPAIYPGNVSHNRYQLWEIHSHIYILMRPSIFFKSLHPNIY